MSYYDFPHTRDYDSDLGFIISRYKKLIEEYKALKKYYENINKSIISVAQDVINTAILNNELYLKTIYDEVNTSLAFIVSREE